MLVKEPSTAVCFGKNQKENFLCVFCTAHIFQGGWLCFWRYWRGQYSAHIPILLVLHPTKEGQFPRDPIFFGQTPVFLEGPWSGDSETVGEIEKGVRIFLREPFSQWKQATRRKSPQWPNVAGTKFWLLFAYTYLFGTGIMWKKLTWQQFSIFGAFSPSEHVRSRFWQNPAEFSVGIGPQ